MVARNRSVIVPLCLAAIGLLMRAPSCGYVSARTNARAEGRAASSTGAMQRGKVARHAGPDLLEELQTMRVKELRERLQVAGYNVADRFDKDSLMELVKAQSEDVLQQVVDMGTARVAKVPLEDAGGYLSLEIKMGPQQIVGKFRIDLTIPFTMISPRWAESLKATVTPECQSGQRSMGPSTIGDVPIGDFLATPYQTDLPPDCCGALGIDFLRKFDWDFDLPRGVVRLATVPKVGSAPVPFDVAELQAHPLQEQPCVVDGTKVTLPWVPAKLLRPKYLVENILDLPGLNEAVSWWASGPQAKQPVVDCKGVIDFGPVTTVKKSTTGQLALRALNDFEENTYLAITRSGAKKELRMANLEIVVGDDLEKGVKTPTGILIDHPRLDRLQLPPGKPCVLMGLEALRKCRFILSLRLGQAYVAE
mmetsp:Transcript_42593/g.97702  ORF Transcript_42593/g.97702 Transcript_42593/m.97702 type:complete len:421 (-) Transcript_42593:81-1343(-)